MSGFGVSFGSGGQKSGKIVATAHFRGYNRASNGYLRIVNFE